MLIMGSIGLGLNLVSAVFLHGIEYDKCKKGEIVVIEMAEHHHHDHDHHHGDSQASEVPMAGVVDNNRYDSSFCAVR